jgi:KaiC/GvpD/RAD55 family RecA-like ATPase
LVSTGVPTLDALLASDGYPDRSAILIEGPPGIGKEALGYWFIRSGLVQGDYCLYATHRGVPDVLRDMKGMGVGTERVPDWIASSGSAVKCDLRDSAAISFNIKQAAHANSGRRVRVATDLVSPLLLLNPLDAAYSYWSQLVGDLKQQDSVLFALAEEGMTAPNALTTMEQLFDGVIEMKLYEVGLAITPLIRVKKMVGLPPLHGYFRFAVSSSGMEVVPHVV